MAAVSRKDLTVINLYRSANANTEELILDFLALIQHFDDQQTVVLCGDFNLCEREDKLHAFRKMLLEKGFNSLLKPPQATHQEGRCLDQAYCKLGEPMRFLCTAQVGTSSFSDHDAIMVRIRHIYWLSNDICMHTIQMIYKYIDYNDIQISFHHIYNIMIVSPTRFHLSLGLKFEWIQTCTCCNSQLSLITSVLWQQGQAFGL